MRLKFIGNPNARDDREVVTVYGVTFPIGVWVDASEMAPHEQTKLAAHNHFEAEVDPSATNAVTVALLSADVPPEYDADAAAQQAIAKKLRKSKKSEA